MSYIILVAGLYLLNLVFFVNIRAGLGNALLFKILPVTLGLILIAHAVKSLGWLAFL